MFRTRFGGERNFVPVPEGREGLVRLRTPDWGRMDDPQATKLKATWIGHASWLIETPTSQDKADRPGQFLGFGDSPQLTSASKASRGVRILFDPLFAERTSPVKWAGPKRYTPTPCTVAELPRIDIVAVSHNHYDHTCIETIKELMMIQTDIHFLCALGNKDWFLTLGAGIKDGQVTELDWWNGVKVNVEGVGSVELTCTPAQHFSGRGVWDHGKTLWCSWVLHTDAVMVSPVQKHDFEAAVPEHSNTNSTRKLFFAGDTGYRYISSANPTPEEEAAAPHCPAFSHIGDAFGPFDLALLPIGLYSPRMVLSSVHCAPEDTVCLHRDIKSKRSIGMHYGTVRGGLSAQYEDVREPPRRFKEACEKAGLKWGEEVGLCDIGETVVIA